MAPYDRARHGPRRIVGPGFHEQVYAIVSRIPEGRVASYGDVAAQLGARSVARHVGFALAALPPERDDVPWHRVVNSRGQISRRADGTPSPVQRVRLQGEGVPVEPSGRIPGFERHRFRDWPIKAGEWSRPQERRTRKR